MRIRRILALVLAAALWLCAFGATALAMDNPAQLTEGVPPAEALAWVTALCLQEGGYAMDADSSQADIASGEYSMSAGPFRVIVHGEAGRTDRVTIAAASLDPLTARQMGVVFGQALRMMTDITDPNALAAIDFSAFDSSKASTQTLIFGDYKIICAVDPDSETPYQLSFALATPMWQLDDAGPDLYAAQKLLEALPLQPSALFSYDEASDPNHVLGQEGQYYSKVTFALPGISPNAQSVPGLDMDDGGSIEVFNAPIDAINRQQKILSTKAQVFNSYEYTMVCGSTLLRLSPKLPPEEVGQIMAAFILLMNGDPASDGKSIPEAAPTTEPQPAVPAPTTTPRTGDTAAFDNTPARTPEVGETVTFGAYPATASGESAPIEWRVLAIENGRALIMTESAVDVYNIDWKSPTWDNSTLRAWLNGEFLSAAFSSDEAAAILESDVPADPNPAYHSSAGDKTRDRVFCLSVSELNRLLPQANRVRIPTAYAVGRGVWRDANGACYWWTRSPGPQGAGAACVASDGNYDYDLSYDGFGYGVCPALWVDLSALS